MVYITGDTHGDILDPRWDWFMKHLNENDTLIVTGDFGFDWDSNIQLEWQNFRHSYTVLFCDGNHENYDILNSLPTVKMFGDEVGVFGNNTYRLFTGHMYLIEGKKYFVFGGAASIDKDWRVEEEERCDSPRTLWWSEEVPTEEVFEEAKKTLEKHNWTFDYFITHTCNPQLKQPILKTYKMDFYDPTESMINSLEYLIRENNGQWNQSFFGHFHKNVHFKKWHCLYGDIVNVSDNIIYSGWDDFHYPPTWEKSELDASEDEEVIYF